MMNKGDDIDNLRGVMYDENLYSIEQCLFLNMSGKKK